MPPSGRTSRVLRNGYGSHRVAHRAHSLSGGNPRTPSDRKAEGGPSGSGEIGWRYDRPPTGSARLGRTDLIKAARGDGPGKQPQMVEEGIQERRRALNALPFVLRGW